MMHHVLGVSGAYPLVVALWLLPLAGAVLCWAFGPQLRTLAGWLVSALSAHRFVLAALSWGAATQAAGGALGAHQALLAWMPGFDFGLLLDPLSLLWTFIITGVGFLIHLLLDRVHGRRRRVRALLRVHELLRVCDAHARALGQLRRAAGRLGAGRPRVVLLDRFLVRASERRRRGAQGVRHERRRRRRHDVRDLPDRGATCIRSALAMRSRPREVTGPRCCSPSAWRCSSAPRPNRRRFRSTPGCRTRWKARHRSRR